MKDIPERLTLVLLQSIVKMDKEDRDALPGSVVKHVKEAIKILKKRQRNRLQN